MIIFSASQHLSIQRLVMLKLQLDNKKVTRLKFYMM